MVLRLVFLDLLIQLLDVFCGGDRGDELLESAFEVADVGNGEEDEVLKALAETETTYGR